MAGAGFIDIVGDVRAADEADGVDLGVGQDGVDRGLVAVHDVQNACRRTGLHHQLGQTDGNGGIALRGLEDEGVADGYGDAEHPHRDHGREVERGDARDHAQRLAHGIDVDAGARAPGVFALDRMRDAAGELDDLEAALHVALGVCDHLAMLAGQQLGQFVHTRLDQPLELEHDAGATLRIAAGPALTGGLGGLHRAIHLGFGGQLHAGLHLTGVRIEDVAEPARGAGDALTVDEVVDVAHGRLSPGRGGLCDCGRFTVRNRARPPHRCRVPP